MSSNRLIIERCMNISSLKKARGDAEDTEKRNEK